MQGPTPTYLTLAGLTLIGTPPSDGPADIRSVGHRLARYNQAAEPGIIVSYLFPDDIEIRLIHLDNNSPATEADEAIAPFYFGPDRTGDIPFPSAIALIRPEEKDWLPLPAGWGEWATAEELRREENS